MQRNSAEETWPMNASLSENEQDLPKDVSYGQQTQDVSKEAKPKCLLQSIKKAHMKYLITFAIIFFVLFAYQICARLNDFNMRANQFQRNIEILKEYPFKGQATQKVDQPSRIRNIASQENSEFFSQNKIQSTQATNSPQIGFQKIDEINKQLKDQSQALNTSNKNSNSPQQITLNNHFEFESSIIQDNLTLSTNPPQTIFKPAQLTSLQEENDQIPLVAFKQLKPTDPQINYQQYTGITVGQLQKAKLFTQIKFFQPRQTNSLIDQQREYYQKKYKISQYDQLPICVVIPTYNNAVKDRHINNMKSILMQEYSNYHIVFIDDASTDSTSDDVIKLMDQQNKLDPSRYLFIRNTKQMKAMHNLRTAANTYCQPKDIFIIVDGDDELIGSQVFKLFNAAFQSSGAWFVYSNFLTIENFVGFSRLIPKSVIQENNYRNYPFVTSHLRAFYTQLFRNIKEQDLRDKNGEYLKAANDVAICIPILEQAQNRVLYVPEITYFYNSQTGLNNHHLRFRQQKRNDYRLRAKPQYKRLDKLLD